MANKTRIQVYLEPEQHRALVELAAARGESLSRLLQEIVGDYLQARRARRERALQALKKLCEIREEIQARHGVLDPDFLEEIREERMRELWERMGWPDEPPGGAGG